MEDGAGGGGDAGKKAPSAPGAAGTSKSSSSAPSQAQMDALLWAAQKKKNDKKNSEVVDSNSVNGKPTSKFRGANKHDQADTGRKKGPHDYKGRGKAPYRDDRDKHYNNQGRGAGAGDGGGQKGGFQSKNNPPHTRNESSTTHLKPVSTSVPPPSGGAPSGEDLASRFLALKDKSGHVRPFPGNVSDMIAAMRAKHSSTAGSSSTPVVTAPVTNTPAASTTTIFTKSQVAKAIVNATNGGPVKLSAAEDPIATSLARSLGSLFINQSSNNAASSFSYTKPGPVPQQTTAANINGMVPPVPKPRQKPAMLNPFSNSTPVLPPNPSSIPSSVPHSSITEARPPGGGSRATYFNGYPPPVSHTPKTTPSSTTNDSDLSSLAELMKAHALKRETEMAQQLHQKEEARALVNAPRRLFNKAKVSRKLLEQCRLLPIYSRKDELMEKIRDNQFLIVIGETGSGKSTQIPQYLVESGLNGPGKIAVTQPRRVAAKSLADRVAAECGVKLGGAVGYAVRFDKKVTCDTIIKYLTDGMLVKECASEMNLDTYSIIIIDEAHERSIHTDVCFGLLKRAAARRPDLKVVISSATLDERKFSQYFNNAPVFNVSGKGYDVQIIYTPKTYTQYDFMHGTADIVMQINRSEPRGKVKGDILVFLPGQEEIENMWTLLDDRIRDEPNSSLYDDLEIVPCYGALPLSEQQRIFMETEPNCRKVVLATNIAETSLTIDGIVYVVDPGYYKQNLYNPKSGIYSLETRQITKFQAIQRAGRAGRTRAGKCYRLYSRHDFERFMKDAPEPEITQCNLESVLLDIIALGIPNPLHFEFMDPPPAEAIVEGIKHLKELSALDEDLHLTDCGRRMSEFPLDPKLAKVILESVRLGCSNEVLKIVALLSTQHQNIFSRNRRNRQQSDQSRAQFTDDQNGDLATLLRVYDAWYLNDKREDWCQARAIQHRILVEADEIMGQLQGILESRRISPAYGMPPRCHPYHLQENIRRAFTAGYFRQLAKKLPRGHAYQLTGDQAAVELQKVFLHPSSSLFSNKFPFVIYQDIMKTTKTYIRGTFPIEPAWILEYAPAYFRKLQELGHI